jgi:primase/DNA polymerase family protein
LDPDARAAVVTTPSILPVQIDSIPGMLQGERRWVLWNREMRGDKPTKVLYQATRPAQRADATDPLTWADFDAARTAYEDGKSDGVGFVLGEPYFGFDADRCRDPLTAAIHPEARELTALLATYTEISPSATGLHAIGRGRKPGPRCRIGRYELYDSARFFCMTGHHLSGTPATVEECSRQLATLYRRLFFESASTNQTTNGTPCHDDDALIAEARGARNGAMFEALWAGDTSAYGDDQSAADLALCNLLAFWTGCDAARMDRLFRQSGLYRTKWDERRGAQTYGERTIHTATGGCRDTYSGAATNGARGQNSRANLLSSQDDGRGGVTLNDFHAYMPMHNYLFAPSREPWPASSVNSRIAPIPITDAKGCHVLDDRGKPRTMSASAWLDRHRPVEQMTWVPGQPMVIRNRLVSDGGWIERPGCTCFNLYRPPQIVLGHADKAGPWLEHVQRVYPDDAGHITRFLAHRVQRPDEKINHALVIGGAQGVGKDTILEPVKAAIGPWNFSEVSPTHLLGRFNGFVKSVILRVSEARDLGEVDPTRFMTT